MNEQVLTGIGAELEQARKTAGLAIDDVARQLKLLPRQIESLEHERFERLPGPTIARGMVRNYARLLKLDAEPLVARMTPPVEDAPVRRPMTGAHREPMPSPSSGQRSTLLYAGFSVVLLALVGAAAYQWQREKAAPEFAAAVERPRPEPVVPETAPAVESPAAPPQAAAALPEAPPPAIEEKPVEKPAAKPEAKPADKPTERPLDDVAAKPAPPAGTHRLVVRMEEEAWLEVRDGTGRSLVASLNPAGTERVVSGQPPFQLVIGNAAHVALTYDGKPVALGPHMRGEVARFTLK